MTPLPSSRRAPDPLNSAVRLPEPPSANRWWRKWRGRMVLSDEARAYKANLDQLRGWQVVDGPVRVTLHWHRGRRSGDLDKRIGVLLDAMQGVFYANDSQIVELHAHRVEAPRDPHVLVRVEPL